MLINMKTIEQNRVKVKRKRNKITKGRMIGESANDDLSN